MGNTYGTWLPGDRRGFRTDSHKHHIPYDYKHKPPPGFYDRLNRRAKGLMARSPVYLRTVEQRRRALEELIASLLRRDIEIAVASIDRIHMHVLARFPDHNPRHWLGIAKNESSHYCRATGHAPAGGLWAAKSECKPVTGPAHYDNALGYIADHVNRGAVVYRPRPTNPLADFDPRDLLVE
jgi:hypothetical protein